MAIEEDSDKAGAPEWLLTYGDMMSLLLTFFIMLAGMSSIKQVEKYQAIADSMRRQFGHEATVFSAVPGDVTFLNSPFRFLASLGRAKRKDTADGGTYAKAIAGDNPFVQTIRPGKDSIVGGVIYFPEDSAELTEDNKRSLRAIIPQIIGKPQKIEIRGHTSRRPVDADGIVRDHWDLAYQRCYNTMQYLIEQGIERERIRLGAAAANEPLDSGIDPELRKRNARVEVLLWDERIDDLNGSTSKER
jgi:chemotaxis protein MotB